MARNMSRVIGTRHNIVNEIVKQYKEGAWNISEAIDTISPYLKFLYQKHFRQVSDDTHYMEMLQYSLTKFNPNHLKEGYTGPNKISFIPYFARICLLWGKNHQRKYFKDGNNHTISIHSIPEDEKDKILEARQCSIADFEREKIDTEFHEFLMGKILPILKGGMKRTVPKIIPLVIMGYNQSEIGKKTGISTSVISFQLKKLSPMFREILKEWNDKNNGRHSPENSSNLS